MNGWWFDWKLRHGLTYRGRVPKTLTPRGAIARFLYSLYFKRVHKRALDHVALDSKTAKVRVFHQQTGGTLGPEGKTNGE